MNKHKVLSLILAFVLVFTSNTSTILAFDNLDSVTYVDEQSGELVTLEAVSKNYDLKNSHNNVHKTKVLRNGQYDKTIIVDFANDIIQYEYADGRIEEDKLSDVVTITTININEETTSDVENEMLSIDFSGNTGDVRSSLENYLYNEPLELDTNGNQVGLANAPICSNNYRAMGSYGGFNFAPNLYGYLQRYDAGIYLTDFAHRFEFSPLTALESAISIISGYLERNGLAIIYEVVSLLIGPFHDYYEAWNVNFERRAYRWLYRVRLNGNEGINIHDNYRQKVYWVTYNIATGVKQFEYAGTAYDSGYAYSNIDLIRYALEEYVAGL